MQQAKNPSRGIGNYFNEIRRFPMLSAEEEYVLATCRFEADDKRVTDQLLTSHLRLAAKIAVGYRRYGLPISDLISEANIGLVEAARRFKPEKGVRFSTYAIWWIKAAIQSYILRSWSLVKLGTTANQKKLFFNLAKAKHRLSALEDGDLRPEQVSLIANRLGVTETEVVEMNRRLTGDVSLNVSLNGDDSSVEWQDRLVDDVRNQEARLAESQESDNRRRALSTALRVLTDRERHIFTGRRLIEPPRSLDELAAKFRISRERVRQIEAAAFRKVQRAAHAACVRRQHKLVAHHLVGTQVPNRILGSMPPRASSADNGLGLPP